MTRSRGMTAAALLLSLARIAITGASPSDARRFPEATCTFDRANATLTVVATDTRMAIKRQGDEIAVAKNGTGCSHLRGAPAVTPVDLIRIQRRPRGPSSGCERARR